MKILVISWRMPWDNAGSAGRKTHNYYLKKLGELYGDNLYLISFCEDGDMFHCDLDSYNIKRDIIPVKLDYMSKIKRNALSLSARFNFNDKYGGISQGWYLRKAYQAAKRLKAKGFIPDIVIFEWTQMLFTYKKIKQLFEESKYIASEHDVSYLSYKRKEEYAESWKAKQKLNLQYENLKKAELSTLSEMDLVFTHNIKDRDLLIKDLIPEEKVDCIVPYYMSSTEKYIYSPDKKDIVFFGAMARPENYLSAIWFIKNVLYQLDDKTIKFYVVGGNPSDKLKVYEGKRIILTGFVDNVFVFFQSAMCLVAPLVLGGGIKIKVLEGLSYGIPVLANELGIEGIPAKHGKDYLFCKNADDYINTINMMRSHSIDLKTISRNAMRLANDNFHIEKSFVNYYERLQELISRK